MLIFILYCEQNRDGTEKAAMPGQTRRKRDEIGGLVRGERNTAVLRSAFCLNRIPGFSFIFRRSDSFGNYCVSRIRNQGMKLDVLTELQRAVSD